jgi:hypothetical protein
MMALMGHAIVIKVTPMDNPISAYSIVTYDSETKHAVTLFLGEGQVVPITVEAFVSETVRPEPGSVLIDGRGVVSIQAIDSDSPGRKWWEHDMVPSPRAMWEIAVDIAVHGVIYPDHGTDCVCMDAYAREVRTHIQRALPIVDYGRGEMSTLDWERNFVARMRLKRVLTMAAGNL